MRLPQVNRILGLTIASLYVIVAGAYFTHQISMDRLFNSDSVYLATLYRDVFVEGGDFFAWNLTPAPYFFPDMPLFFLIKTFIQDTYFAFYFYAALQLGLTYWLSLRLLRAVLNEKFALLPFSIIYVLAVVFLTTQNVVQYSYPLFSAYHFGSIVTGLLFLLALTSVLQSEAKPISVKTLALLTAWTALGTASDFLFLLWFPLPALMAVAVWGYFKERTRFNPISLAKVFLSTLGGMGLGVLLKNAVTSNTIQLTWGYSRILPNLKAAYSDLVNLFNQAPLVMLLLALFYGLVLWRLVSLFRRSTFGTADFLGLFIPLSLGVTLLTLMLTSVLYLDDAIMSRYFMTFYWYPVLLSWLVYPDGVSDLYQRIFYYLWLSVLVVAVVLAIPTQPIYGEYYPPVAQCVDESVRNYREEQGQSPSVGIGNYWHAKLITEFSKEQLRVVHVNNDLSPFMWINNPNWYQKGYDFAVLFTADDPGNEPFILDQTMIEGINGDPQDQVLCEDKKARVLFYEPGALRTQKFQSLGDAFTWKACQMSSHVATPGEDCRLTKAAASGAGFVSFGPFEQLPIGKYAVEIAYASSTEETVSIGFWDVVVHVSGQLNQIAAGSLVGTTGDLRTALGTFEISPDMGPSPFEVRTYAEAKMPMTLYEITVRKVD